MAKLNITFVDELGNNLNRYRAIDINTNEEFIFDLSRDGTITTPGTPLNAERLNAIVNAINSMDTEKQSQIDTLKNETKELREDFDNSFTEKSVTRKTRKLVDYPSKEISYPDQNVTLKQLGGMSYKYNQLGFKGNFTVTVTFDVSEGKLHIYGTSTFGGYWNNTSQLGGNIISGHKYLIATTSSFPEGATIRCSFYDSSETVLTAIDFTSYGNIYSAPADGTFAIGGEFAKDTTFDFYPNCFFVDLTAMYGAGNEPTTVQQFLADYPMYNDYVEYTEGDIINASVSSVDSVGRNLFDESIFNSQTKNGVTVSWLEDEKCFLINGTATQNSDFISTYFNYKASKRAKYTVSLKYISGSVVRNGKNALGNFGASDNINTITTNWRDVELLNSNDSKTEVCNYNYITTFWFYIEKGVVFDNYKVNIQLELSDTATEYTPYKHNNYPIPSSIQALEGYGWGINESCYNYIDFENKKFVKKVGRVDLGTLDWVYSTDGATRFASGTISDIINISSDTTVGNIICPIYLTGSPSEVYTGSAGIATKNKAIWVTDSSYTDAATFKAAMSGVYLYYELATPVEIDIVALNNYPVWQYGTETQNAILPAIMIKEYSISTLDQIVKNIEVDANQTDMIEKLVEKDLAIDNSIKNITTQQTNHSSAISDLSDRVVDLELEKFDKTKLTLQQNLIKTKLLYDGVVISEVNSADVMVTPKIYISVEQVDQYNYNEILKVENDTNYEMYVSMNGKGTHSKFNVPSGLTKTSSKTISIGAEGIPINYTANIELEVYFNSNRTYNNTVGFTLVKNKKIINLVADVTTTDK